MIVAELKVDKTKTFAEIISAYGLTQEQVEFYQSFSRKRTTTRFEKQAAAKVGDPEMIKDWRYEGYYDTGEFGRGKCSLGHKLRYVHFARNIKTGEQVKFGIKCVTDFFKLTPLALKLIRQGFNEANNEIKESLEKFVKFGSFEAYNAKTDIVNRANLVLENNPNALCRPYKDALEESLLVGEMMGFLAMKLPVPNWFEYKINNVYGREMHKLNTPVDNDPIYKEAIAKAKTLLTDLTFKSNHSVIYNTINDMLTKLREHSSMSPKAKDFFDKLVNVEWTKLDPIVKDLLAMNRTDFKAYSDWDFVQKVAGSYNQYGVSPKQAAVLVKIHKGYNQPGLQAAQ